MIQNTVDFLLPSLFPDGGSELQCIPLPFIDIHDTIKPADKIKKALLEQWLDKKQNYIRSLSNPRSKERLKTYRVYAFPKIENQCLILNSILINQADGCNKRESEPSFICKELSILLQ